MGKTNLTRNVSSSTLEDHASGVDEDKFHWKSTAQHIMFFLIYIMDWNSLEVIIYEDGIKNPEHEPTLIHFIVLTITVGGPLIFLQTFVGQYTQRGAFAFGEMLPVAYGFGFLTVLMAFVKLVIHLHYTGLLLFYFFVSVLNPVPPWIICYEKYYDYVPNCFSLRDIDLCPTMDFSDEPCFPPGTKKLAAVLFMEAQGMFGNKLYDDATVKYNWSLQAIISEIAHVGILFIILVVVTAKRIRIIDSAFRLTSSFCLAGSLSISLIAFTQAGSFYGVSRLWGSVHFQALVSLDTWAACFRRLIEGLKLAEGGVVVLGAFIPPSETNPYRSLYLTVGFGLIVIFVRTYFNIFAGLLVFKLNLSLRQLELESEESTAFALFPLVFGIQAFGHFFCFVYFFIMLLLSFSSLIINTIVIEKNLSFHFNIASYYPYVRFFIAMPAYILTMALIIPEQKDNYYEMKAELKAFMMSIICLQILIVHFYGIQRLCDDVQFYLDVKVAPFIKLSWITLPIWCFVFLYQESMENLKKRNNWVLVITCIIFCTPLIICLFYVVVKYGKHKNLIGLLRPMDQFGPSDILKKIYRILYNPRLAVRYKRQTEVCYHDCLHGSQALEKVFAEEIDLIEKFIIELESSKEDATNYPHIISRLKSHRQKLLKRPKSSGK